MGGAAAIAAAKRNRDRQNEDQAHGLQGASNASALETSILFVGNAGGQELAHTCSLNARDVVKDIQVHKLSLSGGWIKRRLVVTKEELLICTRTVRSADLRLEGAFGMKMIKEAPFLQHYFVFEDGVLRFWLSKEDCKRGVSPRGCINTRNCQVTSLGTSSGGHSWQCVDASNEDCAVHNISRTSSILESVLLNMSMTARRRGHNLQHAPERLVEQTHYFCHDSAQEMEEWLNTLHLDAGCFERGGEWESDVLDRIPLIEVLAVLEMQPNFFAQPRVEIQNAYKAHDNAGKRKSALSRLTASASFKLEVQDESQTITDDWLPTGWTWDAKKSFQWIEGTAAFEVYTVPEGYNSGKVFIFRSESPETNADTINFLLLAAREAVADSRRRNRFANFQGHLRRFTHSTPFQIVVTLLIFAGFAQTCIESQLQSDKESTMGMVFKWLDISLCIIFVCELLLNLLANWFWDFFGNAYYLFDTVIVVVSLIAILPGFDSFPGVKQMRIFRTARVVRAFTRLRELRNIVNAISSSILPVIQSGLLLVFVMSIFVTIGVEMFGEDAPKEFGNFFRGFYTLFGVIAYGRWPDDVIRPFDEDGDPNVGTIAFIYTYIIVAVIVLLQIVVAVLLDNFFRSGQRMKEEEAMQMGETLKHPLDAILDFLAKSFMSDEDLQRKIRALFDNIDIDGSGSITYLELMQGVHRSSPDNRLRLTEEDFYEITESGTLLLPESQSLDFTRFNLMILKRLRSYLQRKSAEAVLHMANPVEVEALLLNSKFLMVETTLISNLVQASALMNGDRTTLPRQVEIAGSPQDFRADLNEIKSAVHEIKQTLKVSEEDQAREKDKLQDSFKVVKQGLDDLRYSVEQKIGALGYEVGNMHKDLNAMLESVALEQQKMREQMLQEMLQVRKELDLKQQDYTGEVAVIRRKMGVEFASVPPPDAAAVVPCAAMSVQLGMEYKQAGERGSSERKDFERILQNDLSKACGGHHPNFFVIKNLHPGSIIVDFEIHSDPSGRGPAPLDLADDLARQVHDSGSVLRRGQITKFVFRVLSAGVPTSWALQQTPKNAFPTDSKSRTHCANGEPECNSNEAKSSYAISNNITPRVIPTQKPPARMLDSSMTAGGREFVPRSVLDSRIMFGYDEDGMQLVDAESSNARARTLPDGCGDRVADTSGPPNYLEFVSHPFSAPAHPNLSDGIAKTDRPLTWRRGGWET